MNDVTIFSIATGAYFDYWKDMVESAKQKLDPKLKVQYFVAGDSRVKYLDWKESNTDIECEFMEVSALPWPLTTLFRFKYLGQVIDSMKSEFVMMIDADMKFVSEFSSKHLHAADDSGVVLVQHPGYFRSSHRSMLSQFGIFKFLVLSLKDLFMYLKNGGIGAWETNPVSQAFVKRQKRKIYFCGGIWWGQTRAAKSLIRELDGRIDVDLSNNVIATFHDESHLNSWASRNKVTSVGSEYCFDPRFPSPLTSPIIEAIDKNKNSKWSRIKIREISVEY